MGRKVHPIAFRLGFIKDWQSKWFAERNYTEQLHQDLALRDHIATGLRELTSNTKDRNSSSAGVAGIDIERSSNRIEVTIHTSKPGVVIGKRGGNVDALKTRIEQMTGKKVKLNIQEIHQPELNAYLVAENIAEQITKRVSYKRAMKQATQRSMRMGAQGIKIKCAGRLGGAEMSRSVWEREGRVPLHTLRADIDYAQVHAHTTYGRIGVKVWIYKGDVLHKERTAATSVPSDGNRPGVPAARTNKGA